MLREISGLGFDRVELSHGIRISLVPGILKAVEAGVVKVTSTHNFCLLPMGPSMRRPAYRSAKKKPVCTSFSYVLLKLNWEVAQRINREARTNPQSPYAGKFVGLVSGQVVVVADSFDEMSKSFVKSNPICGNVLATTPAKISIMSKKYGSELMMQGCLSYTTRLGILFKLGKRNASNFILR